MATHRNDMIAVPRWKWEALNRHANRYPIALAIIAVSCLFIGAAVGVLTKSC